MTYEELPFAYKKFSTEKGWEEKQALAYWQQAKEYRGFVEHTLCAQAQGYIGTKKMGTVHWILQTIRGKGVQIV